MKTFLIACLFALPFVLPAQDLTQIFGGRFTPTASTDIGSDQLLISGVFKHSRNVWKADSIEVGDFILDCDCNSFVVDSIYSVLDNSIQMRVNVQDPAVTKIKQCTGGIVRTYDGYIRFPNDLPTYAIDCILNYNYEISTDAIVGVDVAGDTLFLISVSGDTTTVVVNSQAIAGQAITVNGDTINLGGTFDEDIDITSAGTDTLGITTNGFVELNVNGLRVHDGASTGSIFLDPNSAINTKITTSGGLNLHTTGGGGAKINLYRGATQFGSLNEDDGLRIDRITSYSTTGPPELYIYGWNTTSGTGGRVTLHGGSGSSSSVNGGNVSLVGGHVDTLFQSDYSGLPGSVVIWSYSDTTASGVVPALYTSAVFPGGAYAGKVALSGSHTPTSDVDIDGKVRIRNLPDSTFTYAVLANTDGRLSRIDLDSLAVGGGSADGNGIIEALPLGDVNIDGNANDFRIYDLQEFKLSDSLALNLSWYTFKLNNSLTEGLSFKAGATTSVAASVDVNATSGFIATGGGSTKDSLVLNDPNSRFNGYSFDMEIDNKFSVIGDTMDISGVTTPIGFPSDSTFYNSNSALTYDRAVDGNQKALSINDLSSYYAYITDNLSITEFTITPDVFEILVAGQGFGPIVNTAFVMDTTNIILAADTLSLNSVNRVYSSNDITFGVADDFIVNAADVRLGATTTTTVGFYDRYYWENSTPSNVVGDTAIHVWVGDGVGTAEPIFIDKDQFFGGGGATPAIRSDLPTETVTIDPNNNDLQIGTNAANNTGEFEFYALNDATRDVTIYAGSPDSSSLAGGGDNFTMDAFMSSFGAEDGIMGVNYDFLGTVYNTAIFGDSIFIGDYPGSSLNLFVDDMPTAASTANKVAWVQDLTSDQMYQISLDSLGGGTDTDNQTIDTFTIVSNVLRLSLEDDGQAFKSVSLASYLDNTDAQTLSTSRDTITISGGNSIRTPGVMFMRDSITGAALTVNLKLSNEAFVSIRCTSVTSTTLTVSNPWSELTDNTAPYYEGETGVYSFRFWDITGTDNITWPANFYDMGGTALGTDALTVATVYTCMYDPVQASYFCK